MKRFQMIILLSMMFAGRSFGQFIVRNTTGDDVLYVTRDGNVGINQSPKSARLQVLDPDMAATTDLMQVQETVPDGGSSTEVTRLILKDEGRFGIGTASPATRVDFLDSDPDGTDDLFSIRESTPGSPVPILRTRMIVKNDGFVGIATAAPQEQLDVGGAIRVGNTTTTNDGTIRYTGSDLEGYVGGGWRSLTGGSGSSLWSQTGSDIYYSSGMVGVGTDAPSYLMDVHDTNSSSENNLFAVRETVPGSPFELVYTHLVVQDGGLIGIHDPTTKYEFSSGTGLMLRNSLAPEFNSSYAGIYASGGELYAIDGVGNTTLLSPHDSESGDWIFYSKNIKTGRTLRIEMEKLVRTVEKLSGESFLHEWTEDEDINDR